MERNQDEINFVVENYNKVIIRALNLKGFSLEKISISFFANSEDFVDEIIPIKDPTLLYDYDYTTLSGKLEKKEFNVSIYQDFSIGKKILTDCNICKIKVNGEEKTFIKIITPFTRKRSYDFIISKNNEMEGILKELHIRSEKANFKSSDIPIIGIDFKELKSNTIDFLLNEEFRIFCRSKKIQLKRGLVLESLPGLGKTLSLRWLKEQALKNKISFTSFKSPKDFFNHREDYFDSNKKIFVFEDFDALLRERDETDNSPNTVLSSILNVLEGIDIIQDVVSIFTTNKVDLFDTAFLRPGRIDKIITYKAPNEKNMKDFFNAYIPEQSMFFDKMIEFLSEVNCDISYAYLKGICDDINIYSFNASNISEYEMENSYLKDPHLYTLGKNAPAELKKNKTGLSFSDIVGIMKDKLKNYTKAKSINRTQDLML